MDVFLSRRISDGLFLQKVGPQLPGGIGIMQILPVNIDAPSLQSCLRFAEYCVDIETDKSSPDIESGLAALLARETLPWHHARDTGERFYDLRALISSLWLAEKKDGVCSIGMLLSCDASGSGRPEQVVKALGFANLARSLQRTRLVFA
jgi:hypothetical protein